MQHRSAVIGIGEAGIAHIRAFEALAIPVEVVCDINPEAVQKIREYGIATQARYTSNIRNVAKDNSVDMVTICTPDHAHLEPVITMLEAGKHVLIEKPTVTTWEDLHTLSVEVKKAKRKYPTLRVVSLEKYHYSPRNIVLRNLVRSGKLGKISCVEGSYVWSNSRSQILQGWRSDLSHPYNVVAGGAWHSIALLTWLLGLRVKRVAALGNRKAFEPNELVSPDTVVTILEFEEDLLGVSKALLGVEATPLVPRTIFLWIIGTGGAFFTGVKPEEDKVTLSGNDPSSIDLPIEGVPSWKEFSQFLFTSMINGFVEAVDSGQEPEFSLDDAIHVTAVTLAAFESCREGGIWKHVPE
jgi:predicted dehydrogenase